MIIKMIPIYIVSYKNQDRKLRMIDRFKKLNLDNYITFTSEVDHDDSRLTSISHESKRGCSALLQHLDSLRNFLNTEEESCIVCEDDIYISKTLSEKLPSILYDFKLMNLDILMLSYILPIKIQMDHEYHQYYFPYYNKPEDKILINYSHTYHHYPNDIWGAQMYLVSRNYARYILENFDITHDTTIEKFKDCPLVDWIITKNGNRALIYPMLAVEENGINYNREAYLEVNYKPELFY